MADDGSCTTVFVGAGYMTREHLRAFQDISGVKLAGITSRTRDRAEKLAAEFNIAQVFDSVHALYEKTKADLVIVSVPELETNRVCRDIFEHPWVSLIEKPVGYNLTDAEEIEGQARVRKAQAYAALNRRYYSSTRAALNDLIGVEGKRFIHVQDQEDQTRALQAGQPEKVVANWMYANSIHVVDYLSLFGRGKVLRVNKVIPWIPREPWVVLAHVEYDSGDFGIYEGIWNSPGPWSASIHTRDKRWELRPLEKASYQLAGQRNLEQVEPDAWDKSFKPGLRRQANLAVAAAQGQKTDLPTLEESLRSMRLVQKIFGV